MTHPSSIHSIPRIAIVHSDTLSMIGLKAILQTVMPSIEIDQFCSFLDLEANAHELYFHYFVSMDILLHQRPYFQEKRVKTIVLTNSIDAAEQLAGFHCLYVNQPEAQLIKALLQLEQRAHAHGRNLPPAQQPSSKPVLSQREIEVMRLIVLGHINKEIADRLCIGLSTVITHRKNIMEKLHIRSVSALTIYAVTHGYVNIDDI